MKKKYEKSQSLEVEGNSIEEAIEKAAKQFGIDRKKLDIKILSEEEKGLFGMAGAQKAKIRATIIPDLQKKDEPR